MGQRSVFLIAACLAAGPAFSECKPRQVDIRDADGSVASFTVEIADTPAEQSNGLMGRTAMGDWRGMLFVYNSPRPVAFWMRNTLIPLDMIFADASGTVTKVHSNAVPLDESLIQSDGAVQYVLEINGGLAAELGVEPGSTLRAAAIDQGAAAWSCAE